MPRFWAFFSFRSGCRGARYHHGRTTAHGKSQLWKAGEVGHEVLKLMVVAPANGSGLLSLAGERFLYAGNEFRRRSAQGPANPKQHIQRGGLEVSFQLADVSAVDFGGERKLVLRQSGFFAGFA
jgi:hypothetical protein